MKNEQIIDELIYGKRSTMETAGNLMALRNKYQASLIAVDVIGIGAGIIDRLNELLKEMTVDKRTFIVKAINSAEKPLVGDRFRNVRAEMWWRAGDLFYQNKTSIPNDSVLINQLSSVKYRMVSNGQILVEPKEEIKEQLGTSPDRADAYVMGLYALQFARPTGQLKSYIKPAHQVKANAGIGF
jgi:hypothetical protein